jgi:hypothetical protein
LDRVEESLRVIVKSGRAGKKKKLFDITVFSTGAQWRSVLPSESVVAEKSALI